MTGAWDPERPTEGAYSALVSFEGGCLRGPHLFRICAFRQRHMDGLGSANSVRARTCAAYGKARRGLAAPSPAPRRRSRLKSTRTYGGGTGPEASVQYEHFGPVIVMCEKGDLRLTPSRHPCLWRRTPGVPASSSFSPCPWGGRLLLFSQRCDRASRLYKQDGGVWPVWKFATPSCKRRPPACRCVWPSRWDVAREE